MTSLESADKRTGDKVGFAENWKSRAETAYNHWTPGAPQNQIQLAFRMHWELFQELMGPGFSGRRCLEVGCGRATISSYFSAAGFETTALDLSDTVLDTARRIFRDAGLKGSFVQGDAEALPFPDRSFDVTVSIGLLEHFEDFTKVISEQIRVLDSGGIFLGYVVPGNPTNVQADFQWINEIIKLYAQLDAPPVPKSPIYRSDWLSAPYLEVLRKLPVRDIGHSGVYPLPMISPSIDFPFTLMPEPMEHVLVRHFEALLMKRRAETGKNPWLCDEKYGQAFLLWAKKV